MKLHKGVYRLIHKLLKIGGYEEHRLAYELGCLGCECWASMDSGMGIYSKGRLVIWLNPTGTVDVLLENECWLNEVSSLRRVLERRSKGTL